MKKSLLAAPLVVGLAGASWAGTTFYGGCESRAVYERLVAQLDEALELDVRSVAWERGFLASEAITELSAPGADDGEALVRLHHRIEHSPIGLGEEAGLRAARIVTTVVTDDLRDGDLVRLLAGFGGAEPLTLVSIVGFDGTSRNRLRLAPYASVAENGSLVTAREMSWDFDIGRDGAVAGNGLWDGADIAVADGPSIALAGGSGRFAFDGIDDLNGSGALHDSAYRLDLAELRVEHPEGGLAATLRDLSVDATYRIDRRADREALRADGETRIAVAGIDVPMVALDSLGLVARFERIDLTGLLRGKPGEARSSALGLAGAGDGEGARAELRPSAMLGAMIVPGAALGYELVVANAGGEARTSLELGFEGDGSPSGKDSLLAPEATVADLIGATRGSLELRADADAVALTPAAMFLDPQRLAPWVVVDGDGDYRADLALEGLVVDVNGMPMPLGALLGEMLAMPLGFAPPRGM